METIRLKPAENTKHLGIIYGAMIAAGHLAFFGAAWLFGFLDVPEVRMMNVFIQLTGIYFALRQYRKTQHNLNYFRAMSVGFAASAIGTVTFVGVIFIIFQVSPGLFEGIIRNLPMGEHLTVYMACFALLVEGSISGAFATYLLMNWMKTDRV